MQLCKYFLLATGLTCCNINSEGEEETEKCMPKQSFCDMQKKTFLPVHFGHLTV
jgi:hypothetical protein